MKKIVTIILTLIFIVSLSGCFGEKNTYEEASSKLNEYFEQANTLSLGQFTQYDTSDDSFSLNNEYLSMEMNETYTRELLLNQADTQYLDFNASWITVLSSLSTLKDTVTNQSVNCTDIVEGEYCYYSRGVNQQSFQFSLDDDILTITFMETFNSESYGQRTIQFTEEDEKLIYREYYNTNHSGVVDVSFIEFKEDSHYINAGYQEGSKLFYNIYYEDDTFTAFSQNQETNVIDVRTFTEDKSVLYEFTYDENVSIKNMYFYNNDTLSDIKLYNEFNELYTLKYQIEDEQIVLKYNLGSLTGWDGLKQTTLNREPKIYLYSSDTMLDEKNQVSCSVLNKSCFLEKKYTGNNISESQFLLNESPFTYDNSITFKNLNDAIEDINANYEDMINDLGFELSLKDNKNLIEELTLFSYEKRQYNKLLDKQSETVTFKAQ